MNHTIRVILVLLLITSGCHKLNNKINTVELECGSDTNPQDDYIKFLQSEDIEILQTGGNLLAFHVDELASRTSNPGQRIQVTSKGCVALPKDSSGRLDVFTKVPRQGISIALQKSQPAFSRQRLLPIKESYFGFVCPLDGYFAVDTLSVPLVTPAGPNSLTERNRIVAYDESTKSEVVLFEKPFGETSPGDLKLFNTASLKPGEYLLKSTREVIDLRSETQLTTSDVATCPLTIVEKSPNLPDAILRLPASSIVPLGSKLSWTTDKLNNVKFCRKQGQGCATSADFRETAEVLNQEEGVWDYCFLLENKVGQKSEISCKEIRVSGTKPEIAIGLNTTAISTDLPILDFPITNLKYKVQTDHKLALKSDLQKSQMCRVEFSFHGQVNLATDIITCLSAECRGQNLKEFVPCGPEVELDTSALYKTDLIDKAYMKFIVRADDGAGNISIREKSILIDKDRWEYVPLMGTGSLVENEKLHTFFPITDNRVQILTESNKIFEYSTADQTWKELLDVSKLGPDGFMGLKTYVAMPDQTIFGLFRYSFSDEFIILMRKPGRDWERLTGTQSPPGCSWLSNDYAGSLYCKHEGMAYVYSGQDWKEIALKGSEGKDLCYEQMSFAQVDQTQWVQCGGGLFSRKAGDNDWIQRNEFGDGYIENMVEDQFGNIWIASDFWSDVCFVGYFNPKGQWNDAIAGTALKYQTSTVGYLSLSRSGHAQYGSFLWDSTIKDWKPRFAFMNPLSFMTFNNVHKSQHDGFLLWDSSLVISLDDSNYRFTFPKDRWNMRSLSNIDYHSQSQEFFCVAGDGTASTLDKGLISIRKRRLMNWLPTVTDSQIYDGLELARQVTGETYFIAGQKTIYRQNPESGAFEVFRRFSDMEDIVAGTTGHFVFAYQSGKLLLEDSSGNWKEFTLPKDMELTKDQFLKDGKLWGVAEDSPTLVRLSSDGAMENLNIPAECHGGSSTVLTHTENQVYLLGGANMCMAGFEDLIFKPFTIPGYAYEQGSTLVARLSMSRLALRASAEDSSVSIIDLENRSLEGPFTLPTENLLTLQESPRSRQLFALFRDRVERLVNGKWETIMTSKQIAERLGKPDLNLKTLAVDREESFLIGTDAAPLLRIFLE
jgi:hypothetical protein